jgi:hypothetical protein
MVPAFNPRLAAKSTLGLAADSSFPGVLFLDVERAFPDANFHSSRIIFAGGWRSISLAVYTRAAAGSFPGRISDFISCSLAFLLLPVAVPPTV